MFYIPFISYYDIYWTNLLMVSKVHNVLVLHFDVYKLSNWAKETLLESNWDFPESVWKRFSEIVSLTLEYNVKRKSNCLQSCQKFPYLSFKPKISSIEVRMSSVEARQVAMAQI